MISLHVGRTAGISCLAVSKVFISITTHKPEEQRTWMQSAQILKHDQASTQIHWNPPKAIMLAHVPEGDLAWEATNHATVAHSACKDMS